MIKFTMTHEIDCTPERFWQLFFDPSFNEKLYKEGLGFPEFSTVETRETEAEIQRKVVARPKLNMPGPVVKVLGDSFGYTEEGLFDRATGVYRFKSIPNSMADKLRNEGSVRVDKIGERKLRRTVEILVEAKVFALGGLMESSTEKQLRQGWEAIAAFISRHVAEHP